ncbi:DUF1749 domain-containing protein [Paenibacillus sp. sptzw28]|uniref:alpha/beta hydrolase family protein n=1 Tax=Paenibacillus sp. sptzw28 TaxID=715179 RepID=UPI001C6E3A16|nr:alpha/beta fold hydrolase [Paenibacillus sp. sptzw28]QYR19384.1 DUF1749 domain-containing protein [Paenibacillus sp. sptzw28]
MEQILKLPFKLEIDKDLVLHGDVTMLDHDREKPVVMLVHGFKGFKDWGFFPYLSEQLALRGYAAISFNFSCSGVGQRDFDELVKFGKNTYSREQADLHFLMSQLRAGELPLSGRFDRERIALLGHSRGGGNSILYASEHPEFKAVVTWNGIADADLFDETFRKEVISSGVGYVTNARTKQEMPIESSFFEDLDFNAERFNIIDAIAKLPIPVLTVQGDRDSERLVKGHERLREASPNQEHFVISGANHTFGTVHPFIGPTDHLNSAIELTVNFLNKHVLKGY